MAQNSSLSIWGCCWAQGLGPGCEHSLRSRAPWCGCSQARVWEKQLTEQAWQLLPPPRP